MREQMEPISDYIVIRRPAIPKYWDSFARPHVAIVIDDPITGFNSRYYVSQVGPVDGDGRRKLNVIDIDELATELKSGTLLEVRYSATKANLYKLEDLGGVSCWRWIGKYRGLHCFEHPSSINWEMIPHQSRFVAAHQIAA
ncbi:hypothetical protein EU537_10180 [Candidatus Thorarchaeota archaeon]|nr:MAG: hypothetical protein EU537_10180 [Candidatus Thorarchaeota archaeon]